MWSFGWYYYFSWKRKKYCCFNFPPNRICDRFQCKLDGSVRHSNNFNTKELKAIIAFYQSPVGRKMIAIKPEMAQKAMKIGIAWGQEMGTVVGERVIEQLKAEGHTF